MVRFGKKIISMYNNNNKKASCFFIVMSCFFIVIFSSQYPLISDNIVDHIKYT